MDNLYLILHKVRGEPAFDIASQLEGTEGASADGPVWIIPTSGHRAYPWWSMSMSLVSESIDPIVGIHGCMREPPINENPNWTALRDHYAASEPRATPAVSRRVTPATATEDFVL